MIRIPRGNRRPIRADGPRPRISPRLDAEIRGLLTEAHGQLVLFTDRDRWPDLYAYCLVPERFVRHRASAYAARRWAARDLGIVPLRMAFYVPVEQALLYGAERVELVEVVGHEVRHIAQADRPSERERTSEVNEREAHRYGRRVGRSDVARLFGGARRHAGIPSGTDLAASRAMGEVSVPR